MFIKLTYSDGSPFYIRSEAIENFGDQYVSTKENNFHVGEKEENLNVNQKKRIFCLTHPFPKL